MAVLKRRRLFLVGLAAAGLATLGWGCRQARPQAGTLQLWTLQLAPKFNSYMDAVIGRWEQDHPDVPVRWTDLPWGSVERKLLAAVFARTAPDGDSSKGRLAPRGDRDRGGHKSIVVLT